MLHVRGIHQTFSSSPSICNLSHFINDFLQSTLTLIWMESIPSSCSTILMHHFVTTCPVQPQWEVLPRPALRRWGTDSSQLDSVFEGRWHKQLSRSAWTCGWTLLLSLPEIWSFKRLEMYQRKTFGTIHNLIRKDKTIQLQGHGVRPGQGSELPPPSPHNNLTDCKKKLFLHQSVPLRRSQARMPSP